MTDGKWHHVCVTWSTRDGVWEAYQDGVKKGSGQNLSAWHPIKPGGTFILGQEQVRHTVYRQMLWMCTVNVQNIELILNFIYQHCQTDIPLTDICIAQVTSEQS